MQAAFAVSLLRMEPNTIICYEGILTKRIFSIGSFLSKAKDATLVMLLTYYRFLYGVVILKVDVPNVFRIASKTSKIQTKLKTKSLIRLLIFVGCLLYFNVLVESAKRLSFGRQTLDSNVRS